MSAPLYELCPRKKCGEFNMLMCVAPKGHSGPCNFVVDHENDYGVKKVEKFSEGIRQKSAPRHWPATSGNAHALIARAKMIGGPEFELDEILELKKVAAIKSKKRDVW
jgi:hypothetical protein